MRHLKRGRRLNRSTSHRKAMLSNLAVSLLDKERVTTTTPKAKEVRGVVERLITYGKKGDLASIRHAAETVRDKAILKKLFSDISPSYKERNGGYTRIIRYMNRKGDDAQLSIIELVGRKGEEPKKRKKRKKQPQTVKHETAAVATSAALAETNAVAADTAQNQESVPVQPAVEKTENAETKDNAASKES
ncbi:MAG: 50S ribosomal protein L17 [Chitinivibrionales bacterium]|nr:50S ribosomal protein L17 [Chitinivibrionales bacterium]